MKNWNGLVLCAALITVAFAFASGCASQSKCDSNDSCCKGDSGCCKSEADCCKKDAAKCKDGADCKGDCKSKSDSKENAPAAAAPAQSAAPINKVCPISGEQADGTITASYQGKTIALCCNDCKKEFTEQDDAGKAAILAKAAGK